jgi:hypothetical protein
VRSSTSAEWEGGGAGRRTGQPAPAGTYVRPDPEPMRTIVNVAEEPAQPHRVGAEVERLRADGRGVAVSAHGDVPPGRCVTHRCARRRYGETGGRPAAGPAGSRRRPPTAIRSRRCASSASARASGRSTSASVTSVSTDGGAATSRSSGRSSPRRPPSALAPSSRRRSRSRRPPLEAQPTRRPRSTSSSPTRAAVAG